MAYGAESNSGFLTFTIAASTGGSGTVTGWRKIPVTVSNKIHVTATFAGTTGIMKLQGKLASVSSAGTTSSITLASRTQAQRSAVIASTVATAVNWVRAMSTKLTGGAGTLYVGFVS